MDARTGTRTVLDLDFRVLAIKYTILRIQQGLTFGVGSVLIRISIGIQLMCCSEVSLSSQGVVVQTASQLLRSYRLFHLSVRADWHFCDHEMAGRGCTVCITILGGSEANGASSSTSSQNEELSLPVALHSPLSVLKEQLEELTGIAAADQVVILCDLTDIERNNDKLLEGRDYMTLRECGVKNGSVMTLHALGLSAERYAAERKQKMLKLARDEENASFREQDKKRVLETKITAAKADHSYNGVLFDVKCNGPYEVDLLSVSVGGMLGRVVSPSC